MARTKVWSEQSQAWVYADRVVAKDGTSVTIESIEESTVAGGSTRITFSDGNTILVKNGASAYQYAVQAGFTGTEQEFAERLNTKSKITKSDLESSVQLSLNKADSALQPNDLVEWAKDKVSVSDIIDNLTTNVSNKPLSAAQGVVIKEQIDALQKTINENNEEIQEHKNYIFNIDYDAILAFDTSEVIFGNTSATSVLGQAILGQMVLA